MEKVDLTGGRGWLDAPAAASVARIDTALGRPLQIDAAGHSREFQQQLRRESELGGGYYRDPDDEIAPSLHPQGLAIDTLDWFDHGALLNEHGWFQTVLWDTGQVREQEHFEYDASRDRHAVS